MPGAADALAWVLSGGLRARVLFTDRSHGDLHPSSTGVAARRRAVAPLPWSWAEQEHGAEVARITSPGEEVEGGADALVAAVERAAISVRVADCAPVALVAQGGAVAVVHAGWRGLLEGVVERAVEELRRVADGPYRAALGPCIHPECYEFSVQELELLEARFGPRVRSRTAGGATALDLPLAVEAALGQAGVPLEYRHRGCTACGGRWYSHRARRDEGRQVLVAWLEAE